MKPSTHKKIKSIKSKSLKIYYKIMYPLAWTIDKFEQLNNNRMKRKATPEYVAKLLAKDFYKYMCKSQYDNEGSVIIAEWVDSDCYLDPYHGVSSYTSSKSKGRKYSKKLGYGKINEELFTLTMNEFDKLNEYTYVNKIVEDVKHKWGLRAYKYTYHFGVNENITVMLKID